MVVKPTGQGFIYEEEKKSQVNGVAVLAFLVLLMVSSGATVWMALEGIRWEWILAEALGLNLIGIYVLLAFKVAEQWEKTIHLRLGNFIG